MITTEVAMRALLKQLERELARTESRGNKIYAISREDFRSGMMESLGPGSDVNNLLKEFDFVVGKLGSDRKIKLENKTEAVLFPTQGEAEIFVKKVLRNVRKETKPEYEGAYRGAYNGDGSSAYKSLYPSNFNMGNMISQAPNDLKHNPLAYNKLAGTGKASVGNVDIERSLAAIARLAEVNNKTSIELRRRAVNGTDTETTATVDIANNLIGNKQEIRRQIKLMEDMLKTYTQDDLLLNANEFISTAINEIMTNGKLSTKMKTKTTRVSSTGKKIVTMAKPKLTVNTNNKGIRVGGISTAVSTLVPFINHTIDTYIRRNMGQQGALVWRTGRFSKSVRARRTVIDNRNNSIYIYMTYMKEIYGTFSVGGAQYTKQRDPRTLISKSVRQLMKDSFSMEANLYVRHE